MNSIKSMNFFPLFCLIWFVTDVSDCLSKTAPPNDRCIGTSSRKKKRRSNRPMDELQQQANDFFKCLKSNQSEVRITIVILFFSFDERKEDDSTKKKKRSSQTRGWDRGIIAN